MSRYNPRTLVQTPSVSGWGKAAASGIGVVDGYGTATGGIGAPVSTGVLGDGFTYNFLTFNSTGDLTVTKAGLFDILLFAGGGSGQLCSGANAIGAGGGGGGGKLQATIYLSANATVTIGAGAAAGARGGQSSVDAQMVMAGGAAGAHNSISVTEAWYGISTGGASHGSSGFATLLGTAFGNIGGAGFSFDAAGGGGGVGGVGANGSAGTGGAGGAGFDVSAFIGGAALFKGAGGGGGGGTAGGAGGSSGVGGAGGRNSVGVNAAANTASGGGGSQSSVSAKAASLGGSGIVYVRFRV